MTRKENEGPRQGADNFKAKDSALQTLGGSKTVTPVKNCDDSWKLKVKVTGQVNARKKVLGDVDVEIEWADTTLDARRGRQQADDRSETDTIEDKGQRQGRCRAKASGWYLEADKPVSLNDGDDKVVDLVLKPAVWVAFNVVDHRSGAFIGDVHLKSNLPTLGDKLADTLGDAMLDIEHEDLRPGMTCTLLELSHDTIVYEVVGAIASA